MKLEQQHIKKEKAQETDIKRVQISQRLNGIVKGVASGAYKVGSQQVELDYSSLSFSQDSSFMNDKTNLSSKIVHPQEKNTEDDEIKAYATGLILNLQGGALNPCSLQLVDSYLKQNSFKLKRTVRYDINSKDFYNYLLTLKKDEMLSIIYLYIEQHKSQVKNFNDIDFKEFPSFQKFFELAISK